MVLNPDNDNRNSVNKSIGFDLDSACKDVDLRLSDDKRYPDLAEQLKVNPSGPPSFSGINYFDYASNVEQNGIEAVPSRSQLINQLCSVKKVPLPEELSEQFNYVECHCAMGLFPEINRAWLVIDSDIYVWNYDDGSDVAYFDGLNEVILTAGLIKPKPGVFQEHIKYLLCLTTPVDIVVLGVNFSNDRGCEHGEMHLQPDPLYSLSCDNVHMTYIAPSSIGRIFMCGKDGCLYELDYQAQDSWFRKKCKKINHSASSLSYVVPSFLTQAFSSDDPLVQISLDNSRNILYSRSAKGTIQVFDLGGDGCGCSFVTHITETAIANQAFRVARNMNISNFKPIVHIAPVSRSESSYVHLVAITESGVRLYFTTVPLSMTNSRPQSLQLIHVRMAPGFTPATSSQKPSFVHMAFYRQGTTLLSSSIRDDIDAVWCLSQDSFPFQLSLRETETMSNIEGRTWCLTEIPDLNSKASDVQDLYSFQWPEPPSVINQHAFSPRRFVLLSSKGSHIISTMRPLEQLRDILASTQSGDADKVAEFFSAYGALEAATTCLALICKCAEADAIIAEWAVQAFFTFSDAPTQISQSRTNLVQSPSQTFNNDPHSPVTSRMPAAVGSSLGSFIASPIQRSNTQSHGTTSSPQILSSTFNSATPRMRAEAAQPNNEPMMSSKSIRYTAVTLYLARILRPLWHFPLINEHLMNTNTHIPQMWSRLSSTEISWFVQQIKTLKQFMDRYCRPSIKGSFLGPNQYQSSSSTSYKEDVTLMKSMYELVSRCCESLELWRVLCDHQLHIMTQNYPQEFKDKLKHTPFRDFVCAGNEIVYTFVNSLMAKYMDDNAAIDAISEHLREICPTLYSADDALYSKANELLTQCITMPDSSEKDNIIDDAIQLYKKIPHLIDVSWITEHLRAAGAYSSIVSLMLYAALKRDPKGEGLHSYKYQEQNLINPETQSIVKARLEAYNGILHTLNYLHLLSNASPASTIPERPGFVIEPDPHRLTPAKARQIFDATLVLCFESTDELWHVTLYQWLISKDLADHMLNVGAPYLEQYLINTAAAQHPKNIGMLDLLWKHYERRSNYISASKVLLNLAEREGLSMTIHERLEYLSRAIICAKSCGMRTSGSGEGELLHELEEKLDVARIQLQIHQELSNERYRPGTHAGREEAIAVLNSRLIEISELYGDFAEKFDLPLCKLAIVHCASHQDPVLIEHIWKELLTEVFHETASLSPVPRMTAVNQRLVSIGKSYVGHERYFPLSFIIVFMETKSCEFNWVPDWSITTLLEIGVNLTILSKEYDLLAKTKDGLWESLGQPLRLIVCITIIIEQYCNTEALTSQSLARDAMTRCLLDICVSHLVELEAMNDRDITTRSILTKLKQLQSQLKQLL